MTVNDPAGQPARAPRVTVFGPHPLLTVTIEAREEGRDEIHVHAGGQGVWVSRMAAELGAHPIHCGLIGGETGAVLEPLLERLPGERRSVRSAPSSGCYVHDRRSGERVLLAVAWSDAPSRHEIDDLFSLTTAAALESDVLVVCNPFPNDSLPLELYGNLVDDVRSNGTPVLIDLSSPRLDSALEGRPDLVKINDWELAAYVFGPIAEPAELRTAAERVRDAGAGIVVVTRGGDPAFVLHGDDAYELVPPRFERGSREGCGDSMMGGIAAAWAEGRSWQEALIRGAAAGAANFLRHGLGTGSRAVVEELVPQVELNRI
ncbi:MAG: 1-phosphofructokinase family hexose kinase [Thermoleophilaceae bacterium]